jgi:hypothetical protein
MSYTLYIDEQLQTDGELVNHLRAKNSKFILKFFNASYGFSFRTDRSGALFESCIDFAHKMLEMWTMPKQVLLRLFATFYGGLPPSVRADLAYLCDEIGYHPKQTKLQKLKHVCSEKLPIATTAVTLMIRRIQVRMVEARNKFVRTHGCHSLVRLKPLNWPFLR